MAIYDKITFSSVNVELKNGQRFEEKDIPSQPMGEQGNFISFIDKDKNKVYIFPLSEVSEISFNLDPESL